MYDRSHEGRELSFEASGALKSATLVMRDRETDSWWSIMTSSAIGGEMEGAELVELPVATKSTWGDWRAAHPDTRVLSIDGIEHEPHDGYADYWGSERTFRGLEVADDRLPAKEPIFAFWLDGKPFAAPHRDFEGGRLFAAGGTRIYLYRPRGAALKASTRALRLPDALEPRGKGERAVEALAAAGATPLAGFDTFWYTWVGIQTDSGLVTQSDQRPAR